jgi:AcrR family transcriptional regulator
MKTSLSLIANEVGASKPASYHHFVSKEVLFETLYDTIISEIIEDFHTDLESWRIETYVEKLTEVGLYVLILI